MKIVSPKLNSMLSVIFWMSIRGDFSESDRGSMSELYKSLTQVLMVSSSGTFVNTVESVFFVQNFVWKNYPLLLVESTSNFTWTFFLRNFSSRVIYFCQFFFASKIFVKLLFIWVGLDVFPFKLMKKEACHRVQHVKISRNWSLGLCACRKNQTIGRQRKCAQPALMLVTWDTGVSVTEWAIVVMANMANTGKNCTRGTEIE